MDGLELSAALASVIQSIHQTNFARIVLVVQNAEQAEPTASSPRSLPQRTWRILADSERRRSVGFALYNRLDRRLHTLEADPWNLRTSADLLHSAEHILVQPIRKRFVHRFPDSAIESIRARDIDVLLRFGFNILRGGILSAARYGVWSFHHGDNEFYRGGPACFWEVYEQHPCSGVILQILTEELDSGRVLAKAVFPTEPGFSLRRNRVAPYWGSAHLVVRKLWELHQRGWDFVEARCLPSPKYRGRRKLYSRPGTGEIAAWLGPLFVRKAIGRVVRSFPGNKKLPHWRMATRAGGSGPESMDGFRWVESPQGHFYADPFVIEHDSGHHLFFEDFDYGSGRGVIAHADVSSDGRMGPARTVLDTGSHSSFPAVFAYGGELFMIPGNVRYR